MKIVFNGVEYDGVEAMPPDVRRDYEAAIASMRQGGGGELESLLKTGTTLDITTTVRQIVVNGQRSGSIDEMPPEARQLYERAMAESASGGWLPVLLWMALGALIALLLQRLLAR